MSEGLEWRFPKWLLITDNGTKSGVQSTTTPPSGGLDAGVKIDTAVHLDPDSGSNPSKSSTAASSIKTTALNARQVYTQKLNLDFQAPGAQNNPRRISTASATSHS
jgi:hypothetical protein